MRGGHEHDGVIASLMLPKCTAIGAAANIPAIIEIKRDTRVHTKAKTLSVMPNSRRTKQLLEVQV